LIFNSVGIVTNERTSGILRRATTLSGWRNPLQGSIVLDLRARSSFVGKAIFDATPTIPKARSRVSTDLREKKK
jgi:hypothetical protein